MLLRKDGKELLEVVNEDVISLRQKVRLCSYASKLQRI